MTKFKYKFNILEFMMISIDEDQEDELIKYNKDALNLTMKEFIKICDIKEYTFEDGVILHNKKLTTKQQGHMFGYRSAFFTFGGF